MGKQFFLGASERGGDVMSAVLLKVHCLTLSASAVLLVPLPVYILADVEVTTLQVSEGTNPIRCSRCLHNSVFGVCLKNPQMHI